MGVAASQYLARLLLLARGLAAAVSLGPRGYGGWNALNLIFDYGSYAALGAFYGLDLELPATVSRNDPAAARRSMSGAWLAAWIGGAAFAVALIAYRVMGGRAFSTWPGVGLPLLMLVAALMQLGFQYLASSLRAFGRIPAVSAGAAIQAVIGAGLGLALVWRLGPWGLLGGWIAGSAVALIVMKRSIPEAPAFPSGARDGLRLIRLGLPLFAYFVTTLAIRSVDRIALVRFGSPASLGLYSLGLLAAGLVLHVPEAVSYVLFPRIAAAAGGGRDPERTRDETVRTHRAVTLVVPAVASLGVVFAGPSIHRFLPSYAEALPAIRWLAAGAMMLSAATVPGYFLLATGRHGRLIAVGVAGALITSALVFTVASRAADPGQVALAAATGQTIFAIGVLALATREWLDGTAARARLVLASLVPAFVAAALVGLVRRGSDVSWTSAIARAAVWAVLYAPIAIVLGRGIGARRLMIDLFRRGETST
jgi:O-antigen/teichoic acid export membrane protein